jgi:uncharacterized protein (DUF2249 family)
MWIVVIVNQHYPSVLHFHNEQEAKEQYNLYKENGFVVHLAKVHDYQFNEDDIFDFEGINKDNIKTWDIKWYI